MHAKIRIERIRRRVLRQDYGGEMKDRSTVRVAARVVETTDGKALRGNVTHHTAEGARVFTDGARADEGLPNRSSVCRSVGDGKIGWRLRYRELVAA